MKGVPHYAKHRRTYQSTNKQQWRRKNLESRGVLELEPILNSSDTLDKKGSDVLSTTKSKIKSEFHGAGKIGQYVVVSIWESYRVCTIRVDLE